MNPVTNRTSDHNTSLNPEAHGVWQLVNQEYFKFFKNSWPQQHPTLAWLWKRKTKPHYRITREKE